MRLLPKCYHEAYAFVLEREFACAAKSRPLLPESEPGTPHPPSSSSTATATAGSFLERHVASSSPPPRSFSRHWGNSETAG